MLIQDVLDSSQHKSVAVGSNTCNHCCIVTCNNYSHCAFDIQARGCKHSLRACFITRVHNVVCFKVLASCSPLCNEKEVTQLCLDTLCL